MDNICKVCGIKSTAANLLSNEEVEEMSSNCALIPFAKGEQVIRQGVFSTNIVYLRSGLAKIHIHGPYYEQIVRIVKAPSYMGLPTTIGDKINQYSVTVIEDSEVCFINLETFRSFLKENTDFGYQIMMELCQSELELYQCCSNRTQKQMRGKIADVLLDFADRIYCSDTFHIPITQEEFGNLIDASRESVSRVLSEFEHDGIISTDGRKIDILNKKLLLKIGENG